jgi:hypothetical protein
MLDSFQPLLDLRKIGTVAAIVSRPARTQELVQYQSGHDNRDSDG